MYAVGIDLGTTNSAVAVLKGRPVIVEDFTGNRTLPSAVGWEQDRKELIVGIDAKENPGLYNSVLSIKRQMGKENRTRVGPHNWLPEEVSAEILKALKRQVQERTGEEVTDAVITVPAYFQMAEMAATKRAGELAGLNVQQLLAEPSAAVMAYGPKDDEKILVYDLGGGTFDVTIIDYFAGMLTTLAVFGNNNLGGDDFDRRLMRYLSNCVKNEQGISIDLGTDDEPTPAAVVLKQEAEKAKIRLSRQNEMPVRIGKITESNGKPIGIDTVIKTEQFNGLIKDLVDGTLAEVQKALDYAKLKKGDIDTVLLVGGSTYMPLVQQTVRNFFGKEPNKSVNPDLAVAFGAAASLVHEPPENRHVVTVGFIPETTPSQELEISGRTSPASKVKITGGQETVTATANETGHYDAVVPLQLGINTLQVEAISPDGKRKSLEPEPVVYDVNAEQVEEPCAPPAPHLARALSVSCALPLGGNRIITDNAAIILKPQMELPASFSADHFATVVDNQSELVGQVLEGDIPIAGMNTWLAEMRLVLPPNVPGQERVVVNFSVDENYMITAELEVPSINKKKTVRVNIKSTAQQVHIFDQINELLNVSGDRIRPEERARLEQARLTIEDLSAEFRRQSDAGDADGMWNTYNRLTAEGDRLRTALSELGAKYR